MSIKTHDTTWIKAAIAAGVASAFAAVIWSVQNSIHCPSYLKNIPHHLFGNLKVRNVKSEKISKNLLVGGVAGSIIGAATALLLTPKAGRDLIEDAMRSFKDHPSSKTNGHPTLVKGRKIAKKTIEGLKMASNKKIQQPAKAVKKPAKSKTLGD